MYALSTKALRAVARKTALNRN